METEGRLVFARIGSGVGADGQRQQTYSYKMNKFWGSNTKHGDRS